MYSRLITPSQKNSFFVFGARGTGKSTWLQATFQDAFSIDLLQDDLYTDLLARPSRLAQMILPKTKTVVIDEIQKIPKLLDEVHRLIETKKIKFVLTGSSARKLKKAGINLLAGRAYTYFMYPLLAQELRIDFNLQNYLQRGGLPKAITNPEYEKFLESYVRTYLKEEVQQEGLTRNLGAFARFLEVASFSQAQILNISKVARETAIERKVVENYFQILEDLLLAQKISVFAKRAKRKLVAHNKFYFFDTGVYRTLRPKGPLDSPEEIEGTALETLFFQHLVALNEYLHLGYSLHYWRTAQDHEVDFVLYGKLGLLAFEVKRSRRFDDQDLRHLILFLKDYPMAKAYFLYGGDDEFHIQNVTVLPFKTALKQLPELLDRKTKASL